MAEEYLQTKVRGILEPMVNTMLQTCPEEPMRFMLTWLLNYTQGTDITSNGEREELENLRKEIKKYQKQEKEFQASPKEKKKEERDEEEDDEEEKLKNEGNIIEEDNNDFTKIKKMFSSKSKEIQLLQFSNNKLKKINEYISEKIRLREEKEKKEKQKKCQNCGTLFFESTNSENSCSYHPGKIKYFSCRQCGADEYYTCCLKCRECCPACKKGKHLS